MPEALNKSVDPPISLPIAADELDDSGSTRDPIVDVQRLGRSFGSVEAVDDVSFQMRPGLVYGLVGTNGAGKTTLIKHLLGLLVAKRGTVSVFGLDPVRHPVEVLRRIGYLSERRELPEWMRIDQLMRYTSAYYANWDQAFADSLIETFRLDRRRKIHQLSKGMRAQVGLIVAVAHRPELLILDEPSTGLDVVVRRDILNEIVRTVAEDGRAVLFSSHLLDEVEQMSDVLMMMRRGELVLSGSLDEIKSQHRRLLVRWSARRPDLTSHASVVGNPDGDKSWVDEGGSEGALICRGDPSAAATAICASGGEVISDRGATLQEIFVAHAVKS